jgi:hypothetical protein
MLTKGDIQILKEIFFTKADWSGEVGKLATKEGLSKFATKDDLKKFATKEDLDRGLKGLESRIDKKFDGYATKKDLSAMSDNIAQELIEMLTPLLEKIEETMVENRGHRIIDADFERRLRLMEEKFSAGVKSA